MLNRSFLVGCGIAGGEAHKYWRLYVTAVNSGSNAVYLTELEMFSSPGGANVCSGGTASCEAVGFIFSPANAFDGNKSYGSTGFWSKNLGFPHWLKYTFAAPVSVAEFKLYCDTDFSTYFPVDFVLQWSDDDSVWHDVFTKTGETWSVPPSSIETKTYTL